MSAQAPDTLRGRVVLGDDSASLPGQKVVLHRVAADSGRALDSARTGPGGDFAFPLPGPDSGDGSTGRPVYLVTARFAGVLYLGPAVHADDLPAGYRVRVYPAERAADTASVRLRSRTFVVAREDGGLRVMDVVVARGEAGRTLVGPPDSVSGGADRAAGRRRGSDTAQGASAPVESEPWWTVAVPRSAREIRVLPGAVAPEEVTFGPGEARISAAIPPAGQQLVLGYTIPEGSPLEVVLDRPVDRAEFVVTGGFGGIRVPGAERIEPVTAEGGRYERYRTESRGAGDTLRVSLEGGGGGGRMAAWIALAVGSVLLAAAGWARRRGRDRGATGPEGRVDEGGAAARR